MGTEHVSILEASSLDQSHGSNTLHILLKRIFCSSAQFERQCYFETFFPRKQVSWCFGIQRRARWIFVPLCKCKRCQWDGQGWCTDQRKNHSGEEKQERQGYTYKHLKDGVRSLTLEFMPSLNCLSKRLQSAVSSRCCFTLASTLQMRVSHPYTLQTLCRCVVSSDDLQVILRSDASNNARLKGGIPYREENNRFTNKSPSQNISEESIV